MCLDKELYMRFPAVLRDKLLNHELELPDTVKYNYDKLLAYRAVERKADDNREVTLNDFKSYFELGRKPKSPRGVKRDITKDEHVCWWLYKDADVSGFKLMEGLPGMQLQF